MKTNKIKEAIDAFKTLDITGDPRKAGDDFYQKFGVGVNPVMQDKPLERFQADEDLLEEMKKADSDKFDGIHKGTLYYFLFWNAYDFGRYDKALFYIDAAISEDFKHHGINWIGSQAASYLLLRDVSNPGGKRVIDDTKRVRDEQVKRFNGITKRQITVDNLNSFITDMVKDPKTRSIFTAFYTFLLESEERINELRLRSRHGGSIELPLAFLFKGGLIFESLLKHRYPHLKNGNLGAVFKDAAFERDFPIGLNTSAGSLQDILDYLSLHKSLQVQDAHQIRAAFSITAQVRNITGHSLLWDDVFTDENIKELFEQEINAIFYVVVAPIHKK